MNKTKNAIESPGESDYNGRAMEIRLYATLRQIAGTRSVTLPDSNLRTVGDALQRLTAEFPALTASIWRDDGALAGHVAVVLDGRDIRHLDGLATPLGEASRLDVFPPVGGGAG